MDEKYLRELQDNASRCLHPREAVSYLLASPFSVVFAIAHACLVSGGLLRSSNLRRDVRSGDQVVQDIAGCSRAVHTCLMPVGMHFVGWPSFCPSRAISECLPCLVISVFQV